MIIGLCKMLGKKMNLTKSFSILAALLLLVLAHLATATEYTYDPLNRLTQVVYDNGAVSYTHLTLPTKA